MTSEKLRDSILINWRYSFGRVNRSQPGIQGLLETSKAWKVLEEFLYPRDIRCQPSRKVYDINEIRSCFDILNKARMLSELTENFLELLQQQHRLIREEIDEIMTQYEETSDCCHIAHLIMRLEQWHHAWQPITELGSTVMNLYNAAFQTRTFSALPPSFTSGFKALVASTMELGDNPNPPWKAYVPKDAIAKRLDYHLWGAFETLGLVDRYEALISSVCYEYIEAHVLETCAGRWDEPMLPSLREWMATRVVPWMLMSYARAAKGPEEARMMLQGVGSRFDFHVCKTLSDLRTREIFDIIVDYPDSAGALQDLKECLARVDQRSHLVQTLRKADKKRLLHPGADTKDILTQYVSIIRCLRIIDPPGVLLFKVADPIRRYLRERPDTIRCIVASLVGDGESGDSLVDENEPIQPLQQQQVDDYSDPNWEPEPIDAGPEFRTNKPGDVISTLVSIYDSKDLFVKELQVLLAQRLLAIRDGNFDKERRNIEILKIRFGEAALQVCEVMLRDMTDSRRIDQHVQSHQGLVMHPTIISMQFWPPLLAGHFNMPGQFKQLQDEYAREFHLFKPDKKLRWLPHLGTIHMELQLEDRTVEADVPPVEAAFIELFSEKDTWAVDELIGRVGAVDRSASIRALTTWVDLGVLKEIELNTYKLLETVDVEAPPTHGSGPSRPATTIEDTPAILTVQQQQAEQMKVYWKFIEGMLTNLGQLPLDRIQQMLKIAPGYDRTIEQLGAFMEAARREGLVTVKDGMWKLNSRS